MSRKMYSSMAACVVLGAGVAVAQPLNDSCATPQAIRGFGNFSFNSTGAGTDGPEMGCGLGQVNNDVWFCWTAAASGDVQATLCNGSPAFDTVIAVYTGCSCPFAYTELACNDDSCGDISSIDFTAEAGRTYMIRLGGYDPGATGFGSLRMEAFTPGVVLGPVISPVNGNTYYLLEPGSWTQGESAAVRLGGHLATVRSDAENSWIYSNLLHDGGAVRRGWIGLNDAANEGIFVWASGETAAFRRWAAGQPNDAVGGEDYAQIPAASSAWDDMTDLPSGEPTYPVVEIVNGGGGGCDADFNGDGFVDFFDYSDYVGCFESGSCAGGRNADFNGDGFVDFFDYSDYVDAFETGC